MADNRVSREAVEAVLETVRLPDGTGLVSAGRVRSLVVEDGRVGFAIAATAAEREALEPVRGAAEQAVAALSGVSRVLAALVADEAGGGSAATAQAAARPAAGGGERGGLLGRVKRLAGGGTRAEGAASGTAERAGTPAAGGAPAAPRPSAGPASRAGRPAGAPGAGGAARTGPLPGVERIIAVGAGKGGVGKSTVSFNLAVALAAQGWRVGLLDADIYGPSVPTLVGAHGHKPAAPGGGFQPFDAYGIRAMSIGFLVEPQKAMIWRGPMVTGALNQLLRDTRWGPLDCLIVDMPPGTGDIALSLAQQTPLSGAVVVTTPQDLALIDVRKAAAMFQAVNVPVLGMVENMSGFVCPHCGETTDIFGHGGGEREAAATGVPFLGRIALAMAVREASDAGAPVALSEGAVGEAYRAIAGRLMESLAGRVDKPFPRIVFE